MISGQRKGFDDVVVDVGLGGVMTTMLVPAETEVRELLGLPPQCALAGALALGYPAGGKRPTRLRRGPVEDFATVDTFEGIPFAPTAHPG